MKDAGLLSMGRDISILAKRKGSDTIGSHQDNWPHMEYSSARGSCNFRYQDSAEIGLIDTIHSEV
jgi:hypothetical protein